MRSRGTRIAATARIMSTKSRRRAARRHPEPSLDGLEIEQKEEALEAIGATILNVATLGMLESVIEAPPSSRGATA